MKNNIARTNNKSILIIYFADDKLLKEMQKEHVHWWSNHYLKLITVTLFPLRLFIFCAPDTTLLEQL